MSYKEKQVKRVLEELGLNAKKSMIKRVIFLTNEGSENDLNSRDIKSGLDSETLANISGLLRLRKTGLHPQL